MILRTFQELALTILLRFALSWWESLCIHVHTVYKSFSSFFVCISVFLKVFFSHWRNGFKLIVNGAMSTSWILILFDKLFNVRIFRMDLLVHVDCGKRRCFLLHIIFSFTLSARSLLFFSLRLFHMLNYCSSTWILSSSTITSTTTTFIFSSYL